MNPDGKSGCSSNDVMNFASAIEVEARRLFSTREQDVAQEAIKALQDNLVDIQKTGGKDCAGRVFAQIANETDKLPGLRLQATTNETGEGYTSDGEPKAAAVHIEIQQPLGEQLMKRDFIPAVSAQVSDKNFGSVIITQALYQKEDGFLMRQFRNRYRYQALAGTNAETGHYAHITEEVNE